MRLSQHEITSIKNTVADFDSHAKVYLFGSRVDDNKRGGDIDLLIISKTIDLETKLRIRVRLYDLIGEQKIDIVVAKDEKTTDPFVQMALETGQLL